MKDLAFKSVPEILAEKEARVEAYTLGRADEDFFRMAVIKNAEERVAQLEKNLVDALGALKRLDLRPSWRGRVYRDFPDVVSRETWDLYAEANARRLIAETIAKITSAKVEIAVIWEDEKAPASTEEAAFCFPDLKVDDCHSVYKAHYVVRINGEVVINAASFSAWERRKNYRSVERSMGDRYHSAYRFFDADDEPDSEQVRLLDSWHLCQKKVWVVNGKRREIGDGFPKLWEIFTEGVADEFCDHSSETLLNRLGDDFKIAADQFMSAWSSAEYQREKRGASEEELDDLFNDMFHEWCGKLEFEW